MNYNHLFKIDFLKLGNYTFIINCYYYYYYYIILFNNTTKYKINIFIYFLNIYIYIYCFY